MVFLSTCGGSLQGYLGEGGSRPRFFIEGMGQGNLRSPSALRADWRIRSQPLRPESYVRQPIRLQALSLHSTSKVGTSSPANQRQAPGSGAVLGGSQAVGAAQGRGRGQRCSQSAPASESRLHQRAVHTALASSFDPRAAPLVHFLTAARACAALTVWEAEWGEKQGLSR